MATTHLCAYHFGWSDEPGVTVKSNVGPAAGWTWCCVSCLVSRQVVGKVV